MWRAIVRLLTMRFPLASIFFVFFAGIIFWGGFNTALEITNTEAFCISCHEMEHYIFQEFKKTVHFANRTGVRATCPDCHVPREWTYKVIRKIGATNELFHKITGSINTPEKFKAKQLVLAQTVWDSMKASDSRECRNCHNFNSMDIKTQKTAAQKKHAQSIETGKTCIDCHKGVAHSLPDEFLDEEHERFEREGVSCADCHEGMTRTTDGDEWY